MKKSWMIPSALAAVGCLIALIFSAGQAGAVSGVAMICAEGFCDAYALPPEPGLTYQFSATGGLKVEHPDPSFYSAQIHCGYYGTRGGWVSVVVTAPDGSTAATSRRFVCGEELF